MIQFGDIHEILGQKAETISAANGPRMCGKTTNLQGCLLSRTQLLTKSPMNILCTQTQAPDTLQSGGNCTRSKKRDNGTRAENGKTRSPTYLQLLGAHLSEWSGFARWPVACGGRSLYAPSLTHSLTHVGHPRIMDEVTSAVLDVKAKWESCLGECPPGKQSFHFRGDETKVHSLQPTV